MKSGHSLPKPKSALVLALISAVACHGLLLSYLQLQRNSPSLPEALKIKDNTPELLQLSSQPTPLTNLELLPLPNARILPPPRAGLPAKPVDGKQKPQAKIASKAGIQKARQIPSIRTGAVASPPSSPDVPEDLADAVEALRSFQITSQQGSKGHQNHLKPVSALLPSQQESFEKLWAQALPLTDQSMEIRFVPLQRAKSKELTIRHQQFFVMNDRIGLFWLVGQRLWILQAQHPTDSKADSANDSKGRPDR